MEVEVKRPSALSEIEIDAWRTFQVADPALHSPYFTIEFALACDQVRSDTRVAVLRDNGVVKGFLPFHRGPLGYGLPLGGPLGDFQGLIAAKGLKLDLPAIMRASGISVYPFGFVPVTQESFTSSFETQDDCHSANLKSGFDAWYADRMAAHKKSLKRYEAKARQMEKAHGELIFTMDDRDPAAFETLLAWKSAQYHATKFFDVFSVPWTSALLRAIWGVQSDDFAGHLSTLRADGRLVAVHFGMRSRHAAHYWFPAYDPEFARFGPGHRLLLGMIKDHATSGISQVHLGVGDFRYKHQFGGETVSLGSGTAMSPSLGAFCRQSAHMVQKGFEALPLGPVSHLPGRVLRRLDRTMAFRLA